MKKLFLFLFVILTQMFVYSRPEMAICIDAACIQDLAQRKNIQVNGDVRMKIDEEFEVRLPVTYTVAAEHKIADANLEIVCYPFDKGLFFGISAVQFAYSESSVIAMNEISAGWTFKLFKHLIIEPQIVLRDPSGTYSQEYSKLRATFPSYSTFRIRLLAGYRF